MALLSLTYAVAHPIDPKSIAASIEASTGQRTVITRQATDYAALSCRGINGVAELVSSPGRVELELMLPASEYFLAHVDAALMAAGAQRIERDGAPAAAPPNPLATRRWRSLPLAQRLAGGTVGQIVILLVFPFFFVRALWRRFQSRS